MDINDEKETYVMELLSRIAYLKAVAISELKGAGLKNLKVSIDEVKASGNGNMKLKSEDQSLNEL